MKIGIFGGTFDPFTLSHREIVKQVLKQKIVDFVYICPTIVTWHRQNYTPWLDDAAKIKVINELALDLQCTATYTDDLRLRRICSGNKFLTGKYVGEHRYIDTLLKIKSSHEDGDEFYPIIGPDEYASFTSWYAWDSIVQQSKSLVVVTGEDGCGRDGKPVVLDNPEIPAIQLKIKREFLSMSATEARGKFKTIEDYIATMKETIEKENVLLHTPIFDVIKGEKMETGLEPVLVKAPDWVTIIVKDKTGKLLVVKQLRYGSNCQIEEFPCGMVEKNETPQEAVVRELAEETGLKLLARRKGKYLGLSYLGATNPNPAFMTNKMHYFFLNLRAADFERVEQKLDEHERITYEWVDAKEFHDKSMKLAESGDAKVPAILLSAFALLSLRDTRKDEDIDELVKLCEEGEKRFPENGNPKEIEAAIAKEYVESHDLGPDEYDLEYQQMVDDANDPELKSDGFDHY